MIVEPFQPYHVDLLRAQGVQHAQLTEVSHVPASYASVHRPQGPAVTARVGDRILLCGGLVMRGHLGMCWALLSAEVGRAHMLALHKATERFLSAWPVQRLEATVEKGFGAGCRWVEILGFEYEGEMRGYGSAGETHLRYARVRL
jgi:hypothetical protein